MRVAWWCSGLMACGASPVAPVAPEPAPEPIVEEPAAPPDPLDELLALPDDARAQRLVDLGGAVYSADGAARCEVCHGRDGQGIRGGIAPLVPERPWAADCVELASIVLFGTHGSFEYGGLTYTGVMPPLGSRLDDLQAAAVSSFVSARFGRGPACEPVDIMVVRAQGPVSRVE